MDVNEKEPTAKEALSTFGSKILNAFDHAALMISIPPRSNANRKSSSAVTTMEPLVISAPVAKQPQDQHAEAPPQQQQHHHDQHQQEADTAEIAALEGARLLLKEMLVQQQSEIAEMKKQLEDSEKMACYWKEEAYKALNASQQTIESSPAYLELSSSYKASQKKVKKLGGRVHALKKQLKQLKEAAAVKTAHEEIQPPVYKANETPTKPLEDEIVEEEEEEEVVAVEVFKPKEEDRVTEDIGMTEDFQGKYEALVEESDAQAKALEERITLLEMENEELLAEKKQAAISIRRQGEHVSQLEERLQFKDTEGTMEILLRDRDMLQRQLEVMEESLNTERVRNERQQLLHQLSIVVGGISGLEKIEKRYRETSHQDIADSIHQTQVRRLHLQKAALERKLDLIQEKHPWVTEMDDAHSYEEEQPAAEQVPEAAPELDAEFADFVMM